MSRITKRIIQGSNDAINQIKESINAQLRYLPKQTQKAISKKASLSQMTDSEEVAYSTASATIKEQVVRIHLLEEEKKKKTANFLAFNAQTETDLNALKQEIIILVKTLNLKRKKLVSQSASTKSSSLKKALKGRIRELTIRDLWTRNKAEGLLKYFNMLFLGKPDADKEIYKLLPLEIKNQITDLEVLVNKYNDLLRTRIRYIRSMIEKERSLYFSDQLPKDDNGKEILISIKDLTISFGFGNRRFVAVKDVNFDIYKGETFGLVGESGSGKTTIGRAIVRINPVYSGTINYRGVKISERLDNRMLAEMRKRIQMIYQDPAASLNERATVDYIVSEGLRAFGLFENEMERREKVEEVMRSVGLLPEHLRRYPHEFSGGQRQRIGIARSIVMRPEFIIADEPISALDVSIRAQVLNLLKSFQKDYDLTYLFIAHDLSVMRHIADRIAVISRGMIVELADAETLFRHPIHDYTISLLSAIPQPDPRLEKEKELISYKPRFYTQDEKTMFYEIEPKHFVLGTMDEIKNYKIRLNQYLKLEKQQSDKSSN